MMCAPPERSRIEGTPIKGEAMWRVLGGLAAFLYIVSIITLGVKTLKNGHWVTSPSSSCPSSGSSAL
jgi:hypothetical protein